MTKIKTTTQRICEVLSDTGKAKAGEIAAKLSIEENIIIAILTGLVKRRVIKRSRSLYYNIQNPLANQVPAPLSAAEVPSVTAAVLTQPPAPRKLLNMEISGKEFTDLLLGKTLTYREMQEAVEYRYDGFTVSVKEMQFKIRALMLSPHVHIEKMNSKVISYHLFSVGAEFLRCSARAKPAVKPELIIRTARFDKRESEWCRITAVFNALIKPVRQKFKITAGIDV